MNDAWTTIVALTVLTVIVKAAGPVALGGSRRLPRRLDAVIELLAAPLLAALIVVETLESDGTIALDARLAGVGAAGLLLCFRRHAVLTAIVVAAAVTAAARAIS